MASIHPSPSGSGLARRPQLVTASRSAQAPRRSDDAAALARAGAALDKDWIEACRARVQQRLSACSGQAPDRARRS